MWLRMVQRSAVRGLYMVRRALPRDGRRTGRRVGTVRATRRLFLVRQVTLGLDTEDSYWWQAWALR